MLNSWENSKSELDLNLNVRADMKGDCQAESQGS